MLPDWSTKKSARPRAVPLVGVKVKHGWSSPLMPAVDVSTSHEHKDSDAQGVDRAFGGESFSFEV